MSTIKNSDSKKLLTSEQVPQCYREKFIFTGYRHLNVSAFQCILSALQLNNETFNIWTSLIPLIYFTFYFIKGFPSSLWPLNAIPTQFYPLLALEISIVTCLLGSTVAHTFNSMSPRICHICFYIDYTSISIFGIGGSCATYFYLKPAVNTSFSLYNNPNIYIAGLLLLNIYFMYTSCSLLNLEDTYQYLTRTLTMLLAFIYGCIPNFHRVLICVLGGKEVCPASMGVFFFMCSLTIIAAVFYITRVPERYFRYIFDIIGHSHTWFHIAVVLAMQSLIVAIELELEARKDDFPQLLAGVSGWNTFGCMFGTLTISAVLICWFNTRLTASHLKQQ